MHSRDELASEYLELAMHQYHPGFLPRLTRLRPTLARLAQSLFRREMQAVLADSQPGGAPRSLIRALIHIANRGPKRDHVLLDFLRFSKCQQSAISRSLLTAITHLLPKVQAPLVGGNYLINHNVTFGRFDHSWATMDEDDSPRAITGNRWQVFVSTPAKVRIVLVPFEVGLMLSRLGREQARPIPAVILQSLEHAKIIARSSILATYAQQDLKVRRP